MHRLVYLGHDIPDYTERLRKAIRRYDLPPGAPRIWRNDPDFRAWDYLSYIQPSGAMYWQCYLYAALRAAEIDGDFNLWTITILDQRWHFGERHWNFAPGKIEYQVRRALKGLNYLVVIEFETFRNVRHLAPLPLGSIVPHVDHGRLIAPHIQGLVWGKGPSPQQRARFGGGIFGATGVRIEDVYDFAGAVRYLGKPPYRGRSVYRRRNGSMGRRPWPNMSLTLHHLYLRNLHRYCWPELTFAGGEGRAVLAHAKRLWRDFVPGATSPHDPRWPMYAGLVRRWR